MKLDGGQQISGRWSCRFSSDHKKVDIWELIQCNERPYKRQKKHTDCLKHCWWKQNENSGNGFKEKKIPTKPKLLMNTPSPQNRKFFRPKFGLGIRVLNNWSKDISYLQSKFLSDSIFLLFFLCATFLQSFELRLKNAHQNNQLDASINKSQMQISATLFIRFRGHPLRESVHWKFAENNDWKKSLRQLAPLNTLKTSVN